MISQPSKPRPKAPTASLSLVGPRSWLTGPSPRPSDVRCASRRLAEKIQMPKRRRFNSTPVVTACVDAWEPLVHLQLPRQLLFSEPGAEPDTLSQWLWGAWGAGGGIPGLRCAFHTGPQQDSQAFAGFLCQSPKLAAGVLLVRSGTPTSCSALTQSSPLTKLTLLTQTRGQIYPPKHDASPRSDPSFLPSSSSHLSALTPQARPLPLCALLPVS